MYDAAATQIREAMVAASLAQVQVEPFVIVNPTTPAIDLYPAEFGVEASTAAFGITAEAMAEGEWMNVRARVATNDARSNQGLLYEFMDPASDASIVQALYDDPTLGGMAADVFLDAVSGFAPVANVEGSGFHIGVVWRFLILPLGAS